jgi:hypothetical protein
MLDFLRQSNLRAGFSALDRDSDESIAKFVLEEIDCNEIAKTGEQYEYVFKQKAVRKGSIPFLNRSE